MFVYLSGFGMPSHLVAWHITRWLHTGYHETCFFTFGHIVFYENNAPAISFATTNFSLFAVDRCDEHVNIVQFNCVLEWFFLSYVSNYCFHCNLPLMKWWSIFHFLNPVNMWCFNQNWLKFSWILTEQSHFWLERCINAYWEVKEEEKDEKYTNQRFSYEIEWIFDEWTQWIDSIVREMEKCCFFPSNWFELYVRKDQMNSNCDLISGSCYRFCVVSTFFLRFQFRFIQFFQHDHNYKWQRMHI